MTQQTPNNRTQTNKNNQTPVVSFMVRFLCTFPSICYIHCAHVLVAFPRISMSCARARCRPRGTCLDPAQTLAKASIQHTKTCLRIRSVSKTDQKRMKTYQKQHNSSIQTVSRTQELCHARTKHHYVSICFDNKACVLKNNKSGTSRTKC